jgi:5-methylcytosine-specific restriction endonuclease McrA
MNVILFSAMNRKGKNRVSPFAYDLSDTEIQAEKRKARDLRQTQWWRRKLARGICFYCRRSFDTKDLTMDHVIPLSRGGKSTKGNVVPACKMCNNKKKQLLPLEWDLYLKELTCGR